MADLELFYFDHQSQPDWQGFNLHLDKSDICGFECSLAKSQLALQRSNSEEKAFFCEEQENPVPWTAATLTTQLCDLNDQDKAPIVCREKDLESSFACVNVNAELDLSSPRLPDKCNYDCLCDTSSSDLQEVLPDFSDLPEEDLDFEASGKSTDYGFICAVTFLVTGISLVVISYTIPRDVTVNPDSVSAREMETLERANARVGAHLDRCVIAGLSLLTLGGVILSTLLMVSMWKGEMVRRKAFAYSRQSAKLYGSINFRAGGSPSGPSPRLSPDEDEAEVVN
ncbi:transmembrane protein 74 [Clupea harengus]|uniref:Transmembrane protein 74 n=1 Tax=Clupea harengus TaxID=7950 RepID=A0A6P3VHB3_CLUHA|nr:transmembrane protein 74 [Clupea harengus]